MCAICVSDLFKLTIQPHSTAPNVLTLVSCHLSLLLSQQNNAPFIFFSLDELDLKLWLGCCKKKSRSQVQGKKFCEFRKRNPPLRNKATMFSRNLVGLSKIPLLREMDGTQMDRMKNLVVDRVGAKLFALNTIYKR